jgi:hypothetical protein
VSRNRFCDFLADPDSRSFSRFTLIFDGAGSWSLQILHSVFGEDWPVQLLWPALAEWNEWVAARRTAEGSLADASGRTALVSLGSDGPPLVPEGLNTPHTLSAARYESGLVRFCFHRLQKTRLFLQVVPSLSWQSIASFLFTLEVRTKTCTYPCGSSP